MSAESELKDLVELSDRATAGPWEVGKGIQHEPVTNIYCDDSLGSIVATVAHNYNVAIPRAQEVANAAFIAALVNWFRATHSTLTAPGGGDGFVLVPREATEAMCNATKGLFREWHPVDAEHIYRAMIDAALTPITGKE